jgi:type IV pilus assembly protein PilA
MLKWIFLAAAVCVLVFVGVFVVIPANIELNRGRIFAQETAAMKAVQTLNTAQVQYNSTYGRFATSLTELGPPTSGKSNASAADLIPADLAGGTKQGYHFTLQGTPANYTITAVPVSFGSTGSRTFFSDQTLIIRENYGQEPATANSPEVGTAVPKQPLKN